MPRPLMHRERHLVSRIGWLRAAVLGANDGIVSTASLIVGVAAASAPQGDILIAGVAGLVAGAMSMAAREYVSVSSQSDTEKADLSRERDELRDSPDSERDELADIYVRRGVEHALARQVAERLVHRTLARDAVLAGKSRPFDRQAEMRFAAAVVAGMAVMFRAVVAEGEGGVRKSGGDPPFHLALYWTFVRHAPMSGQERPA